MLSPMVITKTLRLTTEQAKWLAQTSDDSRLSENRIVGMLIDRAMANGLTPTVRLGSQPEEGPGAS